jgi:signal transduction histidine kinase
MEQGYALLSQFLPQSGKLTSARHRKSIILVFTHFFILTALLSLLILSKTIAKVAFIPTLCALPCIVGSLMYFKKKGNIRAAGNILTSIWYFTLMPILINTGGLNSSFFPWLYSIILVMVLVENYLGSTLWFLMASLTACFFYFAESFYPSINLTICTNLDSLISYLTVGFFMFVNLAVFKKHQIGAIKSLNEKNLELKAQKKAIAEYANELEKVQHKLTATNQELQNFAYIASHDLKEPLRMIKMYIQLVEKKIKSTLDEHDIEYMFFIKDGVKRMQLLLDNLLAYSLLGKNTTDIKGTNLNIILKKVIQNLTVLIQENNAVINMAHLPIILASGTEMTQLFQNLLANALKFRKPHTPPIINITCLEKNNEFLFTIADNGIGIKKADQERVFDILMSNLKAQALV